MVAVMVDSSITCVCQELDKGMPVPGFGSSPAISGKEQET